MAHLMLYKDIGIDNEATYGSSNLGTARRMHVTSVGLGQDVTKELVEDTMVSPKGRERMISKRNVVEGEIAGYGEVRTLKEMFELVNGVAGTSVAHGDTGAITTFWQNTDGTFKSKAINIDRNNSQEKFNGVVAKSMSLSFSDDILESSVDCVAQARASGTSMTNILGATVEPFTFADMTVTIHQGATYGGQAVTQYVSDFSLEYANGIEGSYLSGSKSIKRVDPKVPELNGSLKIFHEGSSWIEASYGASEFYIRLEGTLPSEGGLIGGVTPYLLRIDIPRCELTTNVRAYEQAEFSVEEIEFVGMADTSLNGVSALWRPQLTTGINI